jgi:hypothetical protein
LYVGHAEAHRTVRVRVASASAAISPPRRHKGFCIALLLLLSHLQAGNGLAARLLVSVGCVTVIRPSLFSLRRIRIAWSGGMTAVPPELSLVEGTQTSAVRLAWVANGLMEGAG